MLVTKKFQLVVINIILIIVCFDIHIVLCQSLNSKTELVNGDSIYSMSVNNARIKKNPVFNKTYYSFKNYNLVVQEGAREKTYLDGNFEIRNYYTNRLLEKGQFKGGLKEGEWRNWYLNGAIKSVENWRKGSRKGLSIKYNNNGKVECKRVFKKNGSYEDVNENKENIKEKRQQKKRRFNEIIKDKDNSEVVKNNDQKKSNKTKLFFLNRKKKVKEKIENDL